MPTGAGGDRVLTGRILTRITADAFSADDPLDPRRAEACASIPVWVWVMLLPFLPGRSGASRACGTHRPNSRARRPVAAKASPITEVTTMAQEEARHFTAITHHQGNALARRLDRQPGYIGAS
jgi:hypothetical protein